MSVFLLYVAGALSGVFKNKDGAYSWLQKEFESGHLMDCEVLEATVEEWSVA